jgi:hypothetical protein
MAGSAGPPGAPGPPAEDFAYLTRVTGGTYTAPSTSAVATTVVATYPVATTRAHVITYVWRITGTATVTTNMVPLRGAVSCNTESIPTSASREIMLRVNTSGMAWQISGLYTDTTNRGSGTLTIRALLSTIYVTALIAISISLVEITLYRGGPVVTP